MKKANLPLTLLIGCLLMPNLVLAAAGDGTFDAGINRAQQTALKGGLFQGDIIDVIKNIILFLMAGAAVLAVTALVWAALLYITAFTNEENVEKAKKVALWAIIGLIMEALAFLIIQIIRKVILK